MPQSLKGGGSGSRKKWQWPLAFVALCSLALFPFVLLHSFLKEHGGGDERLLFGRGSVSLPQRSRSSSCIPETGVGCRASRYFLSARLGEHDLMTRFRPVVQNSSLFWDNHTFIYSHWPQFMINAPHQASSPEEVARSGNWSITAHLVAHFLAQMKDGDFLFYLDPSLEDELISADGMHRAMICADYNLALGEIEVFQGNWTKKAIYQAHCPGVHPDEGDQSLIIMSGLFFIRKSPGTMEFFNKWKRAVDQQNSQLPEGARRIPGLIEHGRAKTLLNEILLCDYKSPDRVDFTLDDKYQMYRITERQRQLFDSNRAVAPWAAQAAEQRLSACFPDCLPDSGLGCRNKRYMVTGRFSFNNSFVPMVENCRKRVIQSGLFKPDHIFSYTSFPDFIMRDRAKLVNHLKFLEDPSDVSKRGGGYWFWKPYLLDHHLQNLNDGDLLLLFDPDQRGELDDVAGLHRAMVLSNANLGLWEMDFLNSDYTKRAVYEAYCPKTNPVTDPTYQHAAGLVYVRKSPGVVQFVKKWKEAVSNWALINDSPSPSGREHSEFQENRHDQSLFNALLICEYGAPNKTTGHREYLQMYTIPYRNTS
jgi:hypothetical protein